MPFTLTREQLYDLVWSEPLQRLGKQIGISDVGLAKQCRNIGVPLPITGYWNKLHAGKPVTKAELPPRDLGTVKCVEIKGSLGPELLVRIKGEPGIASDAESETIEVLTERFRKRLGKVTVPRNFTRTHPRIAKLLEKDEAVRQKRATERFYWRDPKFESPFERRRLRVLNGLFLGFASVGGGGWVMGDNARELSANVGEIRVGFDLDHGKRKGNGRGSAQIITDANEKLFLTVQHHSGVPLGVPTQWSDEEGSPLEDRITDIIVGMAVAGEHLHRRWVAERLAWERERREEAAREERKRVEAAARRERERLAAIAQAKIDGLLRDAGAWREAANIRAYVDAVRQSADGNMTVFDDWAKWALAEADRIDPIISGRFTAGYEHRESK
ncbi:hypothetical protein KMZ93_19825 [Bradyrhizobium sediminis]|uniref:Uncharacterized protein n=1 Tax=Bradyrhizobium sediminis TaxID=2840469 RepID=A0A975NX72_9BRAD|nr:hypothetical protein [Bradyrhizobium sediminis]QWG22209.1 hypothetical protein KMZ93_19825 [Bradyrhizobium sediminis]